MKRQKIPDASAPGNLLEVTTRFELVDEGFADPCLTTWPRHHIRSNCCCSIWSGRRGSNSLPPPWQGGALPDELRPHIRCIYPCTLPFVSQTGPPRKLANARFCGEEEKFQCLSQRSCFARLPDKRLTFRRGASDRNRTNDTGIFSPLLYRLSYRGIESAFIPALPQIRFLNRGPRKNLRSKCLWGRGESLAFITAVLLARLPDEPQDFRRATRIGLEPTTPSVTGWCSNQLSYRATWWKLTGSNR